MDPKHRFRDRVEVSQISFTSKTFFVATSIAKFTHKFSSRGTRGKFSIKNVAGIFQISYSNERISKFLTISSKFSDS